MEETPMTILLPKVNQKVTNINQTIVIIENEGIELPESAVPKKKKKDKKEKKEPPNKKDD
jgi:hypothetical protein